MGAGWRRGGSGLPHLRHRRQSARRLLQPGAASGRRRGPARRASAWRSATSTTSRSTTPTCRARATRRRWRASRSRSRRRTPSSSPPRSTTTPSPGCSRTRSTGPPARPRPAACAGSPSASWAAPAGRAAPCAANWPCGRCSSSPTRTPWCSRNCACPGRGSASTRTAGWWTRNCGSAWGCSCSRWSTGRRLVGGALAGRAGRGCRWSGGSRPAVARWLARGRFSARPCICLTPGDQRQAERQPQQVERRSSSRSCSSRMPPRQEQEQGDALDDHLALAEGVRRAGRCGCAAGSGRRPPRGSARAR